MDIDVLALVPLGPERAAALTAAGYAVREGKKYASRMDAVRDAGDTVRAVLTNGRGGLSGDEMKWLPKLEIVCTAGAGYEAVDLDTARSRGIAVANCPDTNASAVADSAMMLLMATTRHLLQADRFVRSGGWQDQWRVTEGLSRQHRPRYDCGYRGADRCAAIEPHCRRRPRCRRGRTERTADAPGASAIRHRGDNTAHRRTRARSGHRGDRAHSR